MPKITDIAPESPTPAEVQAELGGAMLSAFGSLFEVGEPVNVRTHNGAIFEGDIEDANLVGIVIRCEGDRLFFVSYSGIESAELLERDLEDGDGDKAEPASDGGETAPAQSEAA